jgi:hypothetical protein
MLLGRPLGEAHGPFKVERGVIIYENSFPLQSIDVNDC